MIPRFRRRAAILDGSPTPANKYGAKKVTAPDGTVYDSKREYEFKLSLDEKGIRHRVKDKFVLQEKFTYGEEKVREIAMFPDFTILNGEGKIVAVVDIKGMVMPDFKLKVKLLKHIMLRPVPIFLPSNKKMIAETMDRLYELLK